MIEVDFARCRSVRLADGTWSPVKAHVKDGVRALVTQPWFLLADEMGGMKTAQSIIAACFLFDAGVIDSVIVVAPASVRPVWYDPEIGELQRHLFVDSEVCEVHAGRTKRWTYGNATATRRLRWTVTNYEYIRSEARLEQLLELCSPRTLLIFDESAAVKNHRSQQTKACLKLRRKCGRVILLNGTPIAHSPLDMYAQGQLMSPDILSAKSFFHFRARYAVMGGWQQKQVIGYVNLEDLQARFKPYVLRRLKRDCLDLPPALPPVTLSVPLSPETWRAYKDMRDEMVAWFDGDGMVASASTAAVKGLRLAQLTSGFVGGLDAPPPTLFDDAPAVPAPALPEVHELSREKLDFVLEWWLARLEEDPTLKLLVWCRFRPELARMMAAAEAAAAKAGKVVQLGSIHGSQTRAERDEALRLLHPQTAPPGPVFFGGTYGTGALGLNFTACHTVVNMSYDFSFWKRAQSDARVDRPGQVHPVSYFDIVATGPAGQRTLDHAIMKARQNNEDLATWTAAAWIAALTTE